ncbi:MAG: MCE family protein [Alphaproteobacteria bacterium]|nr:MCE family protein [Alphaproteobacteria bacterium]
METRAHHVLIGSFALGGVLLIVLFTLWIGQFEFDRRFADYEVLFEGGVSGLAVGADVRYSGIKVGQVVDVRLDPSNPANVRVRLQVNADTPVNVKSIATLETGILTGLSVVQISGGEAGAAALKTVPGQRYPLIPSEKTGLQEVVAGAPELIAQGNQLLAEFRQLVSDENIALFNSIVADVKTVTTSMAKSSTQIETVISNAEKISINLESAAGRIDEIAINIENVTRNADRLVAQDAQKVMDEVRGAASNLKKLAGEAEALVRETRPALRDFAKGGLPQIALFAQEGREFFLSLGRVTERFESDPRQFLFGSGPAPYTPEMSSGEGKR